MPRRMKGGGQRWDRLQEALGRPADGVVGRVGTRRRALWVACGGIVAGVVLYRAVPTIAPLAQPFPDAGKSMKAQRFDFRHFERLPDNRRIPEAQAEVERLFPPGSKADDFQHFFEESEAKCSRGVDPSVGPYVACLHDIQLFFH